jgi:hypothetical protein
MCRAPRRLNKGVTLLIFTILCSVGSPHSLQPSPCLSRMDPWDVSPCLATGGSTSIAHPSPHNFGDLKHLQWQGHEWSFLKLQGLRGGFGSDALWTASDRAIDCALEVAVCSETSACSFLRARSNEYPRNAMWDWRGSREKCRQSISSQFQVSQVDPSRPGDTDHAQGASAPTTSGNVSLLETNNFENQHEDATTRNRLESIFRRDATEEGISPPQDREMEDSHGKQAPPQQTQTRCNMSQDGAVRPEKSINGKAGGPKVDGVLAYASSSNYFGHGGSSRSTYRANTKQGQIHPHQAEASQKNSIGKAIRDSVSAMCSQICSILTRDSRDKDSLRRTRQNKPHQSSAIGSNCNLNKAIKCSQGPDGGSKAALSVKTRLGGTSASRSSVNDMAALDEKLQQVINRATVLKDKGSMLYKQGRFEQAIMQYEIAKRIVELEGKKFESDSVEGKASTKFMVACYLNLAASCIEISDYFSAIKHCTQVLERDCDNQKGNFLEQAHHEPFYAAMRSYIRVLIRTCTYMPMNFSRD